MDTLGALALATEPPTDHLMHRSPVGRRFVLVSLITYVTHTSQFNATETLANVTLPLWLAHTDCQWCQVLVIGLSYVDKWAGI